MPKKNQEDYSASSIQVLEGLEPVRKRPGMYIGGTSKEGLHHLIWEVVSNSIDEAMAGNGDYIEVQILPENRIAVMDNGRGIPVEKHPQTKISTLETVMTKLHAGGKFGGGGYKVSGGLHGVGISVVNALSSWTKAEVRQKGKIWVQEYSRGKAKAKVKSIGETNRTGTTIEFQPDPEIFQEIGWNSGSVADYLRKQAYLTKGVHLKLIDKRFEKPEMYKKVGFCFDGGIKSYVKYLTKGKELVNENVFYIEKESQGILIETALQYHTSMKDKIISFANNINTTEGGMHETGFRTALTRVINDYAKKQGFLKEKDGNFTADDVKEGLTAVISVKLGDPQFEGQTKTKLGNSEARTAVNSVLGEALSDFFDDYPQDAKAILNRCMLSAKARLAAKAAKEAVVRKGALEGMTLPGKLADCSSRDASKTELFIVEGDSAGGSAKQGRDRQFQAILPLRGKILNVERARLDRMLSSQEIKSIVIALGIGIGDEMNLEKLRYNRIIIMTDADVDGSHIRTLLLTLFYRHFEDLVKKGHIYIAQPPLYAIKKGKEIQYAYNEAGKEEIIKKMAGEKAEQKKAEGLDEESSEFQKATGISLQRYKGLGEMNPDLLWKTTMDPEGRVMYQVAIEDAQKADEMFNVLMGDDVAPRKKFIQAHAGSVQNLDV
ncbi:MAG: DNA topoisomerase (ATP-hydrolyzing) subunit B [Candidatus Moranbacteria bacterium]|nr:DNA topoisomerase (ATP-hydrolyzing) subunit B [Candidatus Moranbacteria bacterium]